MNFSTLPKIELHLHLDCSLSYEVVKVLQPNISLEKYQSAFIAPTPCLDLADYITRAIIAIDLMQTAEQLRLVTLDLMDQLKKDNVIYAEIRFARLQHLDQGLSPEEVIEIVIDAVDEGQKKTGVIAGLILCTLRHYSTQQSIQTVKLTNQFLNKGVVGFDIAADEAGYPIDQHISAFKFAKEHQIPCTAHAGEARGPESVWETLKHFSVSRLGHGVRSIEDIELLEHLKEKNIHLEVCPTSNIQTAIYTDYAQHPIDDLAKKGLSVGINTDGRTVSNTTLAQEYQHLHDHHAWTKEHFMNSNLSAIEHAFTSPEIKTSLKKQIIKGYTKEVD